MLRIESLLCVYFLSLLIQTLLERELRRATEQSGVESLPLDPAERLCRRKTVIDVMQSLSRHELVTEDGVAMQLHTDPTPLQKQLYGIKPSAYGRV